MIGFISASLWGCLGCMKFQMETCHWGTIRRPDCQNISHMDLFINSALTWTLTLVLKVVSAFCWGRFAVLGAWIWDNFVDWHSGIYWLWWSPMASSHVILVACTPSVVFQFEMEQMDLTVMGMRIAPSIWWGLWAIHVTIHANDLNECTFTIFPCSHKCGRSIVKTIETCWKWGWSCAELDGETIKAWQPSHSATTAPGTQDGRCQKKLLREKDCLHRQPVILTQPEHCLVCFIEKVLPVGAVPHGTWDRLSRRIWKREIPVRPPQMEPLMIFVFISASLWGCLACEHFIRHQAPLDVLMSKKFAAVVSMVNCKQHDPNTCTDLKTQRSKCYLLG